MTPDIVQERTGGRITENVKINVYIEYNIKLGKELKPLK